jgi:hypothetical protein
MLRMVTAALVCVAAMAVSAQAGGEVYGGEPVPLGPPVVGGKVANAPPAMPDDAREAYGEPQFVDGDPYGRTDYWQQGRGNRLGTQYGPGFYERGYYYPGERQFPDYWAYDTRRAGADSSLWTVVYEGVVDPFVPTQREIDAVRAAPMRVIKKLRIDEDLRRLEAMAKRSGDDGWAGGRYDQPRAMK